MKKFLKSILKVPELDDEVRDTLVSPEQEEPTQEGPKPHIELEDEEIQPITERYAALNQIQMKMGQITIEYERKKNALLDALSESQEEIQKEIEALREKHGIPEGEYTLNLPKKDGSPASFIRIEPEAPPSDKED